MDPRTATARQASRIAFGLVLIAGAIRLVATGATHSDVTFQQTWLAAFAAAIAVRWLLPARAQHDLLAASLIIPGIGCALIMPLSIQLIVGINGGWDDWVRTSFLYVGVAHVVFAALMAARGWTLAHGRDTVKVSSIYLIVVLAANVPFPVIPAAIVAITGIPILPVLFYMKRIADRERAAIALPTAMWNA